MEAVQKKVGEIFDVILDNRATSGLSMMYKLDKEGIVTVEGTRSQKREDMVPGDPVKVKYSIHAITPGTVIILFYETQIWNKNFPPLPVKEILVNVYE